MTDLSLIDIGANLTHSSFDKDRDAVIARALEDNVSDIIVTGSCMRSSLEAISLASAQPNCLWATVGVHPHEAETFSADDAKTLRELADRPQVCALGEMGLDYNRNYSSRAAQLRAFEQQLEVAVELQRPVFLHERDAAENMVQLLRSYRSQLKAGVIHCFTGEQHALEAYLNLDMHIGITGWICDERRGTHLQSLVKMIPAGRLMLETDAPYLLPRDYPEKKSLQSGRRNEPCTLRHIAQTVANCREESIEEVCKHTRSTSREFFSLH